MNPPKPLLDWRQTARGQFRVSVVDAKTGKVVKAYPWQSNLILDSGLDFIASASWASQLAYAVAGTGNTPTKYLPDGTYSQSTTTVTRDTGTRDFIAGDVGKLIRWASGEEAKITAFIGVTSVTVSDSKTVAASALDAIYLVDQTGLTTEVKRTNTQPQFIDEEDGLTASITTFDAAEATVMLKVTRDFTEEVAPVNYAEIGMSASATVASNLFSRMLLAGAVTVGVGQLLRVVYKLTVKAVGALVADQVTIDGGITGWPLPYNIESITSTGSNFDVTFTEDHHYLAAGIVNINGAKRPRTDITVAVSTVSDFTITAPGHGISPAETIVIEDMTPSGYNGTFLVDSVSGDDIVVLSVLNPGPGTVFGNVREEEPGTWYDGEWTIASVPTSDSVRITSAINPPDAGEDGTGYNNLKRKFVAVGHGVRPLLHVTGYGAVTENHGKVMGGQGYFAAGPSYNVLGLFDGHSDQMKLFIPAAKITILPNDFPQYWGNQSGGVVARNSAGTAQSPSPTTPVSGTTKTASQSSYSAGNFYRETTFTLLAGDANVSDLNLIGIGVEVSPFDAAVQGYVLFEEPQRKKNTYKLTLTIRRTWGRDLTEIPF